jgi:hypothetical protein
MPTEILELQERAACADAALRREVIRSRLSAHLPLYTLTRYRPPPPSGTPASGDPTSVRVDAARSPSHIPERSEDATDDDQNDVAVVGPEASEPLVDLPDVA